MCKHSAVTWQNKLYIFAGEPLIDKLLYQFDIASRKWILVETTGDRVVARQGHSAVVYKNSMYIYGGISREGRVPHLARFDFLKNKWTSVVGKNEPAPTDGHAAVVYGNAMIKFGGQKARGENTNETYEFNFENDTWSLLCNGEQKYAPQPRKYIPSVLFRGALWVFGGELSSMTMSFSLFEMFEFQIMNKMWKKYVCDPPKMDPSMNHRIYGHCAVVKDNKSMLVFGGSSAALNQEYNQLLEFDFNKFEWKIFQEEEVPVKPRRMMTATIVRNYMVIVGGYGHSYFSDCWGYKFLAAASGLKKNCIRLLKNNAFCDIFVHSQDQY